MLQSQTAGRSTRRKFIHTLPLLLHLVTRLPFWPEIHNSFLLEARDTRHIHNFYIWCPPQEQGTAVRNTGNSRQKVLVWFLISVRGLLCGRGCGFRRWRLLGQYQYWPSIPMPHPFSCSLLPLGCSTALLKLRSSNCLLKCVRLGN